MRRYKLIESQLQTIIRDTLTKLLKGKKSVTITPSSLLSLPPVKKADRPKVVFEEDAYKKMQALVQYCKEEIAWHGTVNREGNTFTITDILVYPQFIGTVTVDADDDRYEPWLSELDDDTYNGIRFQGHSHVNMSATPSGRDDETFETFIQNIKDYYIYFIFNKRDEYWINIYDIQNNLVYEKADVDVSHKSEGFDYKEWFDGVFSEAVEDEPSYNTNVNDFNKYQEDQLDAWREQYGYVPGGRRY